ncbi:MAG: hypothetical protein SGILL_005921 [Bacillariaceae sp.]
MPVTESFVLRRSNQSLSYAIVITHAPRTDTLRLSAKSKKTAESNADTTKPTSKIRADNPKVTSPPPLFANAPTNPTDDDTTTNGKRKKKKKNKYAQFSIADKIDKDPFEALMEESTQKRRSLEKELDPLQQRIKQTEASIPKPPPEALQKIEFPNNSDIDPYDPTTFGYMEIGTILGPHGVHGWSKVDGCTDFPERLTRSGTLLHLKYPKKRAPRKVTLASGKFLGDDSFLIQLQGSYNRTAAQKLQGSILYYAVQQDTVKLEEDEMIVSDLVGLNVFLQSEDASSEDGTETATSVDKNKLLVGKVMGVVLAEEMCAIPGLLHDQMEVQIINPDNEKKPQPGRPPELVLIPLVPEIVPKIDLENEMIVVDPPEGLLDLTYVREEKVRIKGLLAPSKED